MKQFYTYNYLRLDGSPFYVGKGNGNRAYTTHKSQNISTPKGRNRIKLQHWSDEETAIAYEIYQIDFWGRKDVGTGILHNKTDGGGGISGFKNPHTEEWNKKISEAHKGKTVPQALRDQISRKLKGRKMPPESVVRRAAKQRGQKRSPEAIEKTRLSNLGRKHSKEVKDNLSAVVTAQWEDQEYRDKQTKSHSKPWTEKRRAACTEESRKKLSDANKGKGQPWSEARREVYDKTEHHWSDDRKSSFKKKEVKMSECHPDRECFAKGLCCACYQRIRKEDKRRAQDAL